MARVTKADKMFDRLRAFDVSRGGIVAGIDEVGRGCLAGPLVVSCVILGSGSSEGLRGVYDSKQLSHARRLELSSRISMEAVGIGFGVVTAEELDTLGISESLRRAIYSAYSNATREGAEPEVILVDGSKISLDFAGVPYECVVKGDQTSLTIAAASISAKVHRDSLMDHINEQYPEYGFCSNKGYGSPEHLRALEDIGPSPAHRYSFRPIKGRWTRHLG